ncbi:Mediator of RNA polymerase II transcription subunit 27 [Ranunculus cassubicifolius]
MQQQQPLKRESPSSTSPPIQNQNQNQTTTSGEDAPPKQVAMAMERLSQAGRLIADIRLGADRLLEALFVAAAQPAQSSKPPLHLILKEEASMRRHLQDLRTLGRQLEETGVLNGSLRSRSNSWGLHMPLVCPDGAVVAYAWKRQLAGQAGASAVDRTRLALKAFTDQKRRFFPHLEDDHSSGESGTAKRHCGSQASSLGIIKDELIEDKTLPAVLMRLEKETPNVKIFTYQRLDWIKRATSLSSALNETSIASSREDNSNTSSRIRTGSLGAVATDQVAVVELLVPSTFRAIVSLHPAGSVDPDAVAFFSPDEGGSYVHARGFSVYHVFRHITEHAAKALQYFLGSKSDMALYHLLHWICSHQNLFTKACSKCGRLLTMDRQSAVILPPVNRPYLQQSSSTQKVSDQSLDIATAYHIGCSVEDM